MSLALLNNALGYPLTSDMLRGAFDRARDAAALKYPKMEKFIREFQFRDLRAKAGTDTDKEGGLNAAQAQLGHTTPTMTMQYVRHRKGKLVPHKMIFAELFCFLRNYLEDFDSGHYQESLTGGRGRNRTGTPAINEAADFKSPAYPSKIKYP